MTTALLRVGVIYLVLYPNGKIYIGQDRTDDINYFGSADSHSIARDFTLQERRVFRIEKRILVRRRNISIRELNRLERKYINRYRSEDPSVGYNRSRGTARRVCKTQWLRTGERTARRASRNG